MTVVSRPSDARRKALNAELTVPSVSNFFPIENYYDAADKVYQSFQMAINESNMLDDAYVYGKRYCTFCIEAIPEHNYYNAIKYKHLRTKHTRQVQQVLTQLEQVAAKMDEEEVVKQQQRELRAKKEAQERARLEKQRFEELQRRMQKQMERPSPTHTITPDEDLEASALRKLEILRPPPKQPEPQIPRDPSGEEPSTTTSTRYRFVVEDSSDEEGTALPPPLLPPPTNGGLPPPPAYEQVSKHRHFLGPKAAEHHPLNGAAKSSPFTLQYTPSSPPLAPPPEAAPTTTLSLPMKTLQERCQQVYRQFTHARKIEVTGIPTYQGRLYESTNGCTVISALVAARHLQSHGGITDPQIVQVIDKECGPLLREIRSKLGLGGSALIIPSDVHDHLVDRKILKQKHFTGAAGGNILDEAHMSEFVKLISKGDDGKAPWDQKAAATLFFREHVISIVKLPVGPNQVFFDLIDSLPGLNHGGRNMASRTRCTSVEALQVLLKWYTSRKFTDTNCQYIDGNPWDDTMADFDPRVFQGFVWAAK